MVDEDDRTNATSSSTPDFITRLKQYKEFILILVFFMGGAMWVYGYFATKDQVEVVHCLTSNGISLIESRMQKKFFFDELTQKSMELDRLRAKTNISNEESQKVIILNAEIDLIRKKLFETEAKHDKYFHILRTNKCQYPE